MSRLTLALDVMGGDIGPRVIIPAALQALEKDPDLSLLLCGDENQIYPLLSVAFSKFSNRFQIIHTTHQIKSTDDIRSALRQNQMSSMSLALEMVSAGKVEGVVSGGNTAALLGLAQRTIKPLPNIERSALMSLIPNVLGGYQVMLDLGANLECKPLHLVQFAMMGSIFAQYYLGIENPRIALLNVGEEAQKGTKIIRQTAEFLAHQAPLNYIGFLESHHLLSGKADVIVQDGLLGNIALKTLEGSIHHLKSVLFADEERDPTTASYLQKKLQPFNPEQYNGASLLGLNAVVVKSHGSANVKGFTNAILTAAKQVRSEVPQQIQQGLKNFVIDNI